MIMGMQNVIKGHVNELLGLNQDISKTRLLICKKCPIYSISFGGMCNNKLWINPEDDSVSTKPKEGYVQGCGCRLLAKTTLPNSECVAGKW